MLKLLWLYEFCFYDTYNIINVKSKIRRFKLVNLNNRFWTPDEDVIDEFQKYKIWFFLWILKYKIVNIYCYKPMKLIRHENI